MIELVIDYIKKAILDNPIKEEGKDYSLSIYYMNGNDSTEFDWNVNNRTCELMVFYDTFDEEAYISVFITKKGFVQGYVWDTTKERYGRELQPLEIGEYKAKRIKGELMTFDKLGLWDKEIYDLMRWRKCKN